MSFIESTEQFSQFTNEDDSNGFTSSFELGKTDHDYVKTNYDMIGDVDELDEIFKLRRDDKFPSTAATHAAIMKIKSDLKFLCSLKVHDQSINQFTNLEPSLELPFEDCQLLEEIFNSPQLFTDFPVDSYDKLVSSAAEMTFKDVTDMNTNIDHQMEFSHDVAMNIDLPSTTHDETTNSSNDSTSDENERDEVNRRGLKKSGGPLRKLARFGNKQVIKYSDEYHDRRVKNNEAVKKSRLKAKEKQKETESKMSQLARENRTLNDRVDLLLKELQVLKSLYRELNQDLPPSAVRALERVNVH